MLEQPVVRALLEATGCSAIVDWQSPLFRAWIMDADRHQVAVRRHRDLEAIADWFVETLGRLPAHDGGPRETKH